MALATESSDRAVVNANPATPGNSSLVFRAACALVLMTAAANCFLKYLWWTAYSGTLNGIPKLYAQWQAASTRATFYGWTLIVLDSACVLLIYTVIRFRQNDVFRKTARLIVSLVITVIGSAFLALALSWIKQS